MLLIQEHIQGTQCNCAIATYKLQRKQMRAGKKAKHTSLPTRRVRAGYYKEQLRQLQVNGHFQCPRCWINKATRSRLDPVPGTAGEDIFRCNECHFEISTSAWNHRDRLLGRVLINAQITGPLFCGFIGPATSVRPKNARND